MFLLKIFNFFVYNQTLHHDRKHFCSYSLQSFTTAKILEKHNDCFEINGKQIIRWLKKFKLLNLRTIQEN